MLKAEQERAIRAEDIQSTVEGKGVGLGMRAPEYEAQGLGVSKENPPRTLPESLEAVYCQAFSMKISWPVTAC